MATSPTTTPLDAKNPFDPALLSEPWDYYRQLREQAPVYRAPGYRALPRLEATRS